MKKRIYIFPLILLILFASCESILEVEPTQAISAEQAITNKNGLQRAVIGSYDALQQGGYYGHNYPIFNDLIADNLRATGTKVEYAEINNNAILADNGFVEGIWNSIYRSINRVNNVLDNINDISDITQEERDNYEGQMKFLRALHYYNLVRFFGGVPLRLTASTSESSSLNIPRASVDDVYQQIISDLTDAQGKITNTNPGMATDAAVKALLAKVHLRLKNWSEAATFASAVINDYGFSLVGDYGDLFLTDGGDNSETIFIVKFDAQDKNVIAQYFFPGSLAGRKEVTPTSSLISAYENDDTRRNASIAGIETEPYDDSYGIKYSDVATGTDNVYVMRLAEMYLIRAEALANDDGDVAEIQADINQIRNRATLGDTEADDYSALLDEILRQRRLEFAFEGHRWFDLIRISGSATTNILPIPLVEIESNNEINEEDQNPGY